MRYCDDDTTCTLPKLRIRREETRRDMRPRSWALAALLLLVHSPTAVRGVSSLAKWDCKGFLDSAQLSFPVQVCANAAE